MPTLRLVVLSDPHAHQLRIDDASAPSRLSCDPRHQDKSSNPLTAFPEVLAQAEFRPQLIICPGDLADKNNAIAQDHVWRQLEHIKKKTRANRLIGAVGNHDIDSRRANSSDLPNSSLKALSPVFPVNSKAVSDKFWSDGFCFYEYGDACVLLINSCGFHGINSSSGPDEHLHGKISTDALHAIRTQIKSKCRAINMVLVHHHIRQHPWFPNENSHIENGPALLAVLQQTGHRWLVIHGHQHLPDIRYADPTPMSPVIFSAGSLSANLYSVPNRVPRNQAYAVEVQSEDSYDLKGRIWAWDWAPHVGWSPAAQSSGMPYESGFGSHPDIGDIFRRIALLFATNNTTYLSWEAAVRDNPSLSYLIPDDRTAVLEALRDRGLVVHFDSAGSPTILARN